MEAARHMRRAPQERILRAIATQARGGHGP